MIDETGGDLAVQRGGSVVVSEILKPGKEAVETNSVPGAVRGVSVFLDEFAKAGEVGKRLFRAWGEE